MMIDGYSDFRISAPFFQLSEQMQAQLWEEAKTLAAVCRVPTTCELHLGRRHHRYSPGEDVEVTLVVNHPGKPLCSVRIVHEDLSTALHEVFGIAVDRTLQAVKNDISFDTVSGHILAFWPVNASGTVRLDSGQTVDFSSKNLSNSDLNKLSIGDRIWWIAKPERGPAKLVCMSRNYHGNVLG